MIKQFDDNEADTTYSLSNLHFFQNYSIKLDQNDFPYISWKIKDKFIQMVVEPNSFKTFEVSVKVVAEVSGMVWSIESGTKKGIGRIRVNIYQSNSELVESIISENDGYFGVLGLSPGT